MLLIGMLDSPFVRRVAVSMHLLRMDYAHGNWSVGRDFEQIRRYSPLGRVPALVLDDGVTLVESAAILDYLDELAGPERALLPPAGRARREALRLMTTATGAAEKCALTVYERTFRPPEKRHEPWVERCRTQMLGALAALETACAESGEWLVESRLTQADITVACVATFCAQVSPQVNAGDYPHLLAHRDRCEAHEEFRATYVPWSAPRD